jgi:hypothetical protein
MQTVQVHLWDDLDARGGLRVAAAQTVVLEYRRRRVRLDLSDEHEAELAALLAPYLDAGVPEDTRPVTHLGFKAGSKEARDWHAGLRAWADAAGRSSEYQIAGRQPGSKVNYRYPVSLVEDYQEYLISQAEPAA